jgi:hypothetical protein
MSLCRCTVQRRTHRMRSATQKVRPLSQCVEWIVDRMRVGRPCSRFEEWTTPARCTVGPIGAREAPSAAWVRCPGRVRSWTRLGQVLTVQLTKFDALSLFGNFWIGRSVAPAPSAMSFASLLFALRLVRCNHPRPPAGARMQVLEVPFEVLSGMIGGPS